MLQSDGNLTTIWQGTTAQLDNGFFRSSSGYFWASYSTMYRKQLWVAVVVNKRASLVARLPLKVYQRSSDGGRNPVPTHPYARLLRRPSSRLDPVMFWTWTNATRDIYGMAFWGKVRDPGGRPIELVPLHPTAMRLEDDGTWTFNNGRMRIKGIRREDLVIFTTYNPDSLDQGMSPLEPLRETLENETAARTATSTFWRNGARPSVLLSTDKTITGPAQDRLKASWDSLHSGVESWSKTAILEEGLKPVIVQQSAEEMQYIETRKLNREEVVAAYDMPPPAVQILDRATFSNITEQFRSIYRDTAAPILNYDEAVLEMQLRGSVRPGGSEPDFGDDVYAEFLLDEVLRGDFEARQQAYAAADYMTLAEKRKAENLPFIEGTDRIIINSASVPLDLLDAVTAERVNRNAVPANLTRTLMGRLSWQQDLDDVDPAALIAGLNGEAEMVLNELEAAKSAGEDVPALKARLRALET